MSSVSALMAIKVVCIIVLGAAFVWWQFHDLAQEKKRAAQLQAELEDKTP